MKENYKRVVCLHSLCGARDILLNCCLESAISHLQAADEKYPSCLTGTFLLNQSLKLSYYNTFGPLWLQLNLIEI